MSVKRLYQWLQDRSLATKVIAPTLLVLALGLAFLANHLVRKSRETTIAQSVTQAETLVNHYKTLRAYYTDQIVSRVRKAGGPLKVSFNHKGKDDTIPLPATVIHDLSEEHARSSGLHFKLSSNYPFPHRKDRILDDFAREALAYLERHPEAT